MSFSRATKRLLAGVATAFLLLCQTAMAAQACGLTPAMTGEGSANAHCRDVIPQSGDGPGDPQQAGCPSDYASASFAKLDIPQVADLPGLQVEPVRPWAPAHIRMISVAPPARAEPPSLIIVHCCLRN